MDTVILVDIEGVLATKNMRCLLSVYNRVLKLGIQDDTLARVRTRDVFDRIEGAKVIVAWVARITLIRLMANDSCSIRIDLIRF